MNWPAIVLGILLLFISGTSLAWLRSAQKMLKLVLLNYMFWLFIFNFRKRNKKMLKTLSFKMNKVDAKTYSLSLYELKFQVWLYSVEFEQSYSAFSYWWTGMMNRSDEHIQWTSCVEFWWVMAKICLILLMLGSFPVNFMDKCNFSGFGLDI